MGIFSHDEEPSWSDVISLQEQLSTLNENYNKLQVENEQLKKEITFLKKRLIPKQPIETNPLIEQIGIENRKFHKCYALLQEIKEIAKLSYQMELESKDCIICDDYLGQILQKIAECEVE